MDTGKMHGAKRSQKAQTLLLPVRTQKEVAEILGVSTQMVQKIEKRAVGKLRERLRAYGAEE